MQPLKPEERARILAEHPEAQPSDLEEYESLLSERFTIPPEPRPAAPEAKAWKVSRRQQIEHRLRELQAKIFGKKQAEASQPFNESE